MRLHGASYGLPALLDPDEPFFMITGLKMIRNQSFNPGWFGHPGTTMLYAVATIEASVYAIGLATGRFASAEAFAATAYQDPGIIFMPVRYFFIACGAACVFLTIRIADRLFGTRPAIIAGVLLAINPLHIKWSQVVRTDVQATVFMLLCVLVSINVLERGRWRDYLVAGAMAGLACATKWPCAVILLSVLAAGLLRLVQRTGDTRQEMLRIAAGLIAAPLTLIMVSPYLLLDSATVVDNLAGEAQVHHLGATGGSFLWNLGWYLSSPLADSIGILGLLLTATGTILVLRTSRTAAAILLPPVMVFTIAICAQQIIWGRWILPLLPFVSIFAAVATVMLAERLVMLMPKMPSNAAQAGVLAFMAMPMIATANAQAIERQHDTRSRAADWAKANVPRGSTVMLEHFGLDMVGQPWAFLSPIGAAGCIDAGDFLKGKTTADFVGGLRGKSSVVDLGTIDPSKLPTCRADYAILSDFDRYRAEASFYGDELKIYNRYIQGGRQVAHFAPASGKSGGPVVRIFRFAAPIEPLAAPPSRSSSSPARRGGPAT